MENNTIIQFVNTFGGPITQGEVNVDTNSQFSINFAVGDIKDPFGRKGVKSYKFTIVGSKEVNKLFNHYYDININDGGERVIISGGTPTIIGSFDHNKRQKVVVLRNGIIILDNAYMQLLSIKKTSDTAEYSDQEIFYEVEVGNDATGFFTDITNKYLSDLNFDDMSHVYNSQNVYGSFPHPAVKDLVANYGGYKYVLPWIAPGNSSYLLEDCRPAISVYEYWRRIHQAAGYTWNWDKFDSDDVRMDKLWIPYNGDKPKISNTQFLEVGAEIDPSTSVITSYTHTGTVDGHMRGIINTPFILDTEVKDLSGCFDPITGIYTANIYTGTGAFDVYFDVKYTLTLDNTSAGTAYFTSPNPLTQDIFGTYIPTVGLTNQTTGINYPCDLNPEVFHTVLFPTSYASIPSGTTTYTYTMRKQGSPITNVSVGDTLKAYTELKVITSGSQFAIWRAAVTGTSAIPVTVNVTLEFDAIEMILVPRTDTYGYKTTVNMNDFVPQRIKQSDFIKAICNMYNLIVDIDPYNDKKINYTIRDNYYDSGTRKDWTKKLVTEKESTISFISDVNSKKVVLTYKPDNDIVNKDYTSRTKETYGQLEYTLENENIKGKENKEIIFSPSPIAATSFGTINPIWVPQTPKTNIRILLDGGIQNCGEYDIFDYNYSTPSPVSEVETALGGRITTYPMLTHFDNPLNPTFDINFGLCDGYLYPFNSQTNNNLYSMFWRRTINQIDTGKLLTCYLQLTEYDISILKLNDKIWIKDTWYNINSLTYDPNSFGPTKVVLMTVDTMLKLMPDPKLSNILSEGVIHEALTEVDAIRKDQMNWNSADSSVLILGTGNTVTPETKNTIILGDNNSYDPTLSNSLYAESAILDNLFLAGYSGPLSNISNVVNINYVDLTVFRAAEQLQPNTVYHIIDRDYWIPALTENTLSLVGQRLQRVVLPTYYTISGINLGIWYVDLTPSIGDIVVWGGKVWKNLTGAVGSAISVAALDGTNWALQVISDDTYYMSKTFSIIYDFDNDWVSRQLDEKNNLFGIPLISTPGYNPVDVSDWGNPLIYSNNNFGVYNNANNQSIYNNTNTGYIYNNANVGFPIIFNSNQGSIFGNLNNFNISNNSSAGSIYNNTNIGGIYNNSNKGNIGLNANIGDVKNNGNLGNIQNNTSNVLHISNNTNTDKITNNSNIGSILDNTCYGIIGNNTNGGSITANSNNGGITSNSNSGVIEKNSNDGTITNNTNSDLIARNSNSGDINANTNIGVIENNSNLAEIINNANLGNIHSNSCSGGIIGNTNNGSIYTNSNAGTIYLNGVNVTDIFANSNADSIDSNTNTGNIKYNTNTGTIYLNANLGSIAFNGNMGEIKSNINSGVITYNTTLGSIYSNGPLVTNITGNSEEGDIHSNNNAGSIEWNSNGGNINSNTNSGDIRNNSCISYIQLNSNSGEIIYNTNLGNIYNNQPSISYISHNANSGHINDNSTIGYIYENTNAGDISTNTQVSGTCKIANNNNNGYITGARTTDVLGTIVNL